VKLAAALTPLKWKGKGVAHTVSAFVSSERAVLTLQASSLCADTLNLGSQPTIEPSGTKSFLKQYLGDARRVNTNLKAFVSLLSKYEEHSDKNLVGRINKLTGNFQGITSNDEDASQKTLTSALAKS